MFSFLRKSRSKEKSEKAELRRKAKLAKKYGNPDEVDESHFEIVRLVGKGSFGRVYAARRKDSDEIVALKHINKSRVARKLGSIVNLWKERNIIVALIPIKCSFLLTFQNVYQTADNVIYVLPFLAGGDLSYHFKHTMRRSATEDQMRFFASEMLMALETLHEHSYVFRDFKMSNVMLDNEGHVYLTDFSIIKRLEEKNDFKTSGRAGTRGHMAPEVVIGKKYSFNVDFYSYGTVLYQVVHRGRKPWKNNDDMISNYKDQTWDQNMVFKESLSKDCVDFLRGLLSPSPKKRLGSKDGWNDVKNHPFLASVNWEEVKTRKATPLTKPASKLNFDKTIGAIELYNATTPSTKRSNSRHRGSRLECPPERLAMFDGLQFNTTVGKAFEQELEDQFKLIEEKENWLEELTSLSTSETEAEGEGGGSAAAAAAAAEHGDVLRDDTGAGTETPAQTDDEQDEDEQEDQQQQQQQQEEEEVEEEEEEVEVEGKCQKK